MKSIILLITALTIGGIGGWTLISPTPPQPQTNTDQTRAVTDAIDEPEVSDIPVAEDFLSPRPALDVLDEEHFDGVTTE